MNIWTTQIQDKYGIDLTKTDTNDEEVSLSNPQKIMSAIAADLYYQHAFLNRNLNIDKLNALAKAFPQHPELNLLLDAGHYFGMSLQAYLHDAEGGIISINAHTTFAQNRTGSVPGQLVNQVILPGIREITAQYTGSQTGEESKHKRGFFFSKAHSSLIKRVEEDMLRIMFMENYQPYMVENPVEHTITNEVYHDKNAELMRSYDALLFGQTQKINEEYNQNIINL